MICLCITSIYAYDKQSTLIEVGDEQLSIGYFALDTMALNNNNLGATPNNGGSAGGISTSKYKLPKEINLSVLDGRYESGSNVFSTLELSLPQQLLSQSGTFEYSVVGPDGTEYQMKAISIDNNKNKLLVYDLPKSAQDGIWTMKGDLKFDGYEPIKVSDTFKVKNYTLFIWYLLAIIILTTMAMIMYIRRRNKLKY